MRSQIDIIIYLDCFRNIDVFLQGLYYLQIRLSNDAVPYQFESNLNSKKFHNLYPGQILGDSYASKIFLLKYAEEIVKISEYVVFRVEIDTSSYNEQTLTMTFDLMFTDLNGDLSITSVNNYINSSSESLFKKVGESTFYINSLLSGVNQVIFVTFLIIISNSMKGV